MQKRSLFKWIFGKETNERPNMKTFELINSTNATFNAWNNKLFESDIVRAAIRPKAHAISKLSAKHIRGYDENMKINPDAHIREVLENPNPYMSMQDFLMKMAFQREINHNAFAYVKRDPMGHVLEIYPIPSNSVELLQANNELYARFRFLTGKQVVIHYDDLIHLRKDFNENDFFGEDGKKALYNIMEVINTTDQGIINAVKNSAIIKWILKFKSVLQPKDKELQVSEFVKNYLSITNEGGAAASDPRYDLEQVKDNNFIPNAAQMKESIQRLYSYFGVNDMIVQNKYTEDDWNSFYESEIEPVIIQLSNAFTKAFFSSREKGHGNKIIFEAVNLAYASMRTKLGLVSMVDRGAMSPNEWRKIMNLPPIEGGNKPIRRLDTVPVSDLEKDLEEEAEGVEEIGGDNEE